MEQCLKLLGDRAYGKPGEIYCNGTFDSLLCWPATRAGETIRQNCPDLHGLDPTRFSEKKCGVDGRWVGRTPNDTTNPWGWTNYTGCYAPEVWNVYNKFLANKSDEQKMALKTIAYGTRMMEIVGLSLSLVSLTISCLIFIYFRSLKCHRTRIHKNLFCAMIIQVIIRLVLYVDQWVLRTDMQYGLIDGQLTFITKIPTLCKSIYSLLEYTKTVCFMWMFIEGFYLHNMIVVSVFSGNPNYLFYYFLGWGSPLLSTGIWVIVMLHLNKSRCWFSYYFLPSIWIMDGQRLAVIVINLIFLFNIMRILITKLRESHTNEAETLRKAVKAATVLLPLLGITNFVVMIEPSQKNVIQFGVWAYISFFLISFQGLGISLIYCFLNSEVQTTVKRHLFSTSGYNMTPVGVRVQSTIKKKWYNFRLTTSGSRRFARSHSVYTSVSEVQTIPMYQVDGNKEKSEAHAIPLLPDHKKTNLVPKSEIKI